MEYIWTTPLAENGLLKGECVSITPSFWLLSVLFFQADSFYCSSFVHLIIDVRDGFFLCSFCLFPLLLVTLPSPAALFFSSFMTLHISPLLTWNQKEAARRGDFFFLCPFFRLRSIVFVFFFFPFLWRESERGAKCVPMQIAPKESGLAGKKGRYGTGAVGRKSRVNVCPYNAMG